MGAGDVVVVMVEGLLNESQKSVLDICGVRMISSMSSSSVESWDIKLGRDSCPIMGDIRIGVVRDESCPIGDIEVGVVKAETGILRGGIETVLGLAFSSDPGSNRSINLGLCPEKLGLGEGEQLGNITFESSNKLLKLLVT